MSKKTAVSTPRESGPYDSGRTKNQKPELRGGPNETGKREKPNRESGAYVRKDKPLTHAENANTHSGRPHPPADRLADSKLLGGKLRKANEEKK